MREIAKRRIPFPAPEFTEAGSGEWTLHEGLCVDADGSPRAAQQMECAEVKHQDQSDHSHPTGGKLVSRRNTAGHDCKKHDPDE
jgi:hypothetical protein